MKKACIFLSVFLILIISLGSTGCKDPLPIVYLKVTTATGENVIKSMEGLQLSCEEAEVSWSVKGCDNGDVDPNNDLSMYDASSLVEIDQTGLVKPNLGVTKGNVRIFATSKADPYRYGYIDLKIKCEITNEDVTLTGNVGTDTNTNFWTAFSEAWLVPQNESRTVIFKNITGGLENAHNFLAVLSKTPLGDAGYSEYAVIRADNAGWCGDQKTWELNNTLPWNLSCNWNWETFKTDMNNAGVKLCVTNFRTIAKVEAEVYTEEGRIYYQSYSNIPIDGPLYFFLTCEKSYLKIAHYVETEVFFMENISTLDRDTYCEGRTNFEPDKTKNGKFNIDDGTEIGDGYFKIVQGYKDGEQVSQTAWYDTKAHDTILNIDLDKQSNGTGIVFTVRGTANVEVTMKSTGDNNRTYCAFIEAPDGKIPSLEGINRGDEFATGYVDGKTEKTFKCKNLTAGTYAFVIETDASNKSHGRISMLYAEDTYNTIE